jgi:hypothetical protein
LPTKSTAAVLLAGESGLGFWSSVGIDVMTELIPEAADQLCRRRSRQIFPLL